MTIGLISGNFFQMAYVTNDIDRAMDDFRKKAGIESFFFGRDAEFDIGGGRTCKAHVALVWINGVQLELIEPVGAHDHVYRQILTDSPDYQLHFHHEARTLDSIGTYEATKAHVRDLGFDIVIDAVTPGYRYFYADARPFLGHHVEYFHFSDEAMAYFKDALPSY